MKSKQTTEWTGTDKTDTSQAFANWFDNISKSTSVQNTKATMAGTGESTVMGKTSQDMSGTSDTTGATTTKNEYEYKAPQDTADIGAYRAALTDQNRADPSIKYAAASAMRSAKNRYGGPFGAGAGSSAATRQQMFKSEEGGIREREGQGLIQDAANRRQQQLSGLGNLASLTKGQLVQTGGTSTSTQTGRTSQQAVGTSEQIGTSKNTQTSDSTTTGTTDSESMGAGGGEQTGSQTATSQGKQTTSTPMWGQLIGGAAQVGAAAASKGAV